METPRAKRSWWQKKTNWVIGIVILTTIMPEIPFLAAYVGLVLKITAALGLYSVADRAGKSNEE